jgi:hypothetical protein
VEFVVELAEFVDDDELLAPAAAELLAAVVAGADVLPENALSSGGSQKYNPTSNNKPSNAVLGALAFISRRSCCESFEISMIFTVERQAS